jgi:hypothetical protein
MSPEPVLWNPYQENEMDIRLIITFLTFNMESKEILNFMKEKRHAYYSISPYKINIKFV